MKKHFLLTAASALAMGSLSVSAEALPLRAGSITELQAYEAAVSKGTAEDLQAFMAQYPDSTYSGEVFGRLVQQVNHKSKGFERSGNPKASGGPLNPGKGKGPHHY